MNAEPMFPLDAPCLCDGVGAECVCLQDERVLRYVAAGHAYPAFSAAQRQWCVWEILSSEGWSEEAIDAMQASDAELSRGVLAAWRDYCRDMGLIE